MSIDKGQIRHGHNIERQHVGISDLTNAPGLNKSAQTIANRLARRDVGIEHSRYWWRIIDRMTRSRFGAKGENLAVGFSVITSLMSAWMESPLHRKNILSRKFSKFGVGIAIAESGQEYYVVHFGGKG